MKSKSTKIEKLFDHSIEYTNTTIELLKLQAVDKVSNVLSSLISRMIIIILAALFLLVFNIGIALWIGDILGKSFYGFFIVAAFYFIILLLLYFTRHKWLKRPLGNYFINQILNK